MFLQIDEYAGVNDVHETYACFQTTKNVFPKEKYQFRLKSLINGP